MEKCEKCKDFICEYFDTCVLGSCCYGMQIAHCALLSCDMCKIKKQCIKNKQKNISFSSFCGVRVFCSF